MISKEYKIAQNSARRRWQYQPLTSSEIKQIHETSMKVFDEIGFEVQEPEAFELFRKAGAKIDNENNIIRLKETQIEAIISTTPSQVKLYGKKPEHTITLGADNVYFGTGGTALNILDHNTGIQRPAKLQDLIDIVRIADKLENIHLMLLPTYPNDVPVKDVDVNRFLAGMMYTSKHIMGGIYTSRGINDVIVMAEKVAGGAKALREKPIISMIACGISPLRLDSKYGKFVIQIARQSIPLAVPVEPLCGATAPVTLAGTLVIQNCDGLIQMMLTQLANPGAPAIYGSVATSVNLHDIRYLGGPVESGMLNAATAQLAKYYGFPYYSTAGISDSKTLDTQCGYETAINNLLVALAGGDFIHDAAGLMEFATTVSKEKLVIDNDILGIVGRAVRGIDVNPDTLAFEVIRKAGAGGNFVANRHTRKYMHREHYIPTVSNRENREIWGNNGSITTAEKASMRVTEILSEAPILYVDDALRQNLMRSFSNIKKNDFQKNS
jgi:trimethylamine--corrinoid protein Co-methyltransferase